MRHIPDTQEQDPSRATKVRIPDYSDMPASGENAGELPSRSMQNLVLLGSQARSLSHDFSRILMNLMSVLQLCRNRLPVDQSELLAQVDAALRSGERASQLLRGLLAFSSTRKLEHKPVALADVVEDALDLMEPMLSPRTSLSLDLDPCSVIIGDENALLSVVFNLLCNARDAIEQARLAHTNTDEKNSHAFVGRIHVSLQVIQDTGHDIVTLAIRDNGCGMDEQALAHISMAEAGFSTKGSGGSGLGMAIVRDIVHRHAGGIWIDSTPGTGTQVELRFPMDTDVQASSSVVHDPRMHLIKPALRVLAVDDDASTGEILAALLALHNIELVATLDGASMLGRLNAFPAGAFHVALVDAHLPDTNIVELARHIHARAPALPLVLLTGDVHASAAFKQAGVRFAATLLKPIRAEGLAEVLRSVATASGPTEEASRHHS